MPKIHLSILSTDKFLKMSKYVVQHWINAWKFSMAHRVYGHKKHPRQRWIFEFPCFSKDNPDTLLDLGVQQRWQRCFIIYVPRSCIEKPSFDWNSCRKTHIALTNWKFTQMLAYPFMVQTKHIYVQTSKSKSNELLRSSLVLPYGVHNNSNIEKNMM